MAASQIILIRYKAGQVQNLIVDGELLCGLVDLEKKPQKSHLKILEILYNHSMTLLMPNFWTAAMIISNSVFICFLVWLLRI
jgi:hypothetical protein